MGFDSHTTGGLRSAAALVNVATPGFRQGRPFVVPTGAELRRSVTEALLISGRRPRQEIGLQAMPDLLELAAALRPVFACMQDGDPDGAAAAANRLLARYRPEPSLERAEDAWHLHFHGNKACDPTGWAGGMVIALATALASESPDRLGVCEAPVCDRVFFDVSRNGTRRFCSTACQNRVKSAAHRARRLANGGGQAEGL